MHTLALYTYFLDICIININLQIILKQRVYFEETKGSKLIRWSLKTVNGWRKRKYLDDDFVGEFCEFCGVDSLMGFNVSTISWLQHSKQKETNRAFAQNDILGHISSG